MRGGVGGRLVASHALGATAISLPWPLLLAEVWSATESDTWLGLTGAVRLLPYVLLSTAAGILADRIARTTVLRWSAALRTLLLAGAGAAVLSGQLGLGVGLGGAQCRREHPGLPGGGSRDARDRRLPDRPAHRSAGHCRGGRLRGRSGHRRGADRPGRRSLGHGVGSRAGARVLGTPGRAAQPGRPAERSQRSAEAGWGSYWVRRESLQRSPSWWCTTSWRAWPGSDCSA